MSISVTNATQRIKVINLPHKHYCAALGRCACHTRPGRPVTRVAASLTVPAGATIDGLADAVLSVPAIARDIRTGEIRIHRTPTKQHYIQLQLLKHDITNQGDP